MHAVLIIPELSQRLTTETSGLFQVVKPMNNITYTALVMYTNSLQWYVSAGIIDLIAKSHL